MEVRLACAPYGRMAWRVGSIDRLLSLSLLGATTTDIGIAATTSVPAFAGDDFFSPLAIPFPVFIFIFIFLCLC
ncbi:hypothetical protein V8C35DRAFT_293618 [Trichoderma chlorosporum]